MASHSGEGQKLSLVARTRHLLEVLLMMLQSRFQLASLELQEEIVRWLGLAVLALMGFFFGQLALLLLTLSIVALFPEHTALALAVSGGLFLLVTGACVTTLLRRLKERPPPFADSMAELKKDREWLSSLN